MTREEFLAEREVCRERERLSNIRRMKEACIGDRSYFDYQFGVDDNPTGEASLVARKYVENWEEMAKENIGILFYGGVGTGKTFLACCIANELLERGIRASVTSFPTILYKLKGFGNGTEEDDILGKLARFPLLVIDDLGAERDTAYSLEQVFNVVDTRLRARKPTIFTTNLGVDELESAGDIGKSRIYDRVLEMCPIRLPLVGESRRGKGAEVKKGVARRVLLG